mgnify:FL=1
MKETKTTPEQQHCCPFCGSDLPAGAAFCPHCARRIRPKTRQKAPRPLQKKFLYLAAVVALAALVAGSVWLYTRPQTQEGDGGVEYTDEDGSYQVIVASSDGSYEPTKEVLHHAEAGQEYRFPLCVTFYDSKTGENVSHAMGEKIASATVAIEPQQESDHPWKNTEPAYHTARPGCALTTLIDFRLESGDARLTWTLKMKNGDTLRMHTDLFIEEIPTAHYYPDTTPMHTIEELQTLVDHIDATVPADTIIYIHLPAVTYEGGLSISGRGINLLGSQEGRTVFTGNTQVTIDGGPICYFDHLDFRGDGSSIGLSASARVHLTNCTISGWKTGVLAYGRTWVNCMNCRFEDNKVGLHFNATDDVVSHTIYSDNEFTNNGTAVLLESVPTDVSLKFPGSVFSGNGTDIDNRCAQDLDISQAVFH